MKSKLTLELVWWIATAILVTLFVLPIYSALGDRYTFYVPNIFFIILFVTYTRLIFLTKYSFLSNNKWLKVIFVFLSIPLFFYAMDALFNFQDFFDRDDHIKMLSNLTPDKAVEFNNYIKYQFLFFGTGGMIVLFMMPVKMIISIWKTINLGRD